MAFDGTGASGGGEYCCVSSALRASLVGWRGWPAFRNSAQDRKAVKEGIGGRSSRLLFAKARARYFRSCHEGDRANEFLMNLLRPKLMAAWRRWGRRRFEVEWLNKSIGKGAKVWVH